MLKKSRLKEKLKKLKISGPSTPDTTSESEEPGLIKQTPLPKPGESIRQKIKKIRIKPQVKQSISSVPEERPAEEPLLKAKKTAEIEEKKPEEVIEPLIPEKKKLTFISDLAIPAHKLSKIFKVETSYTENTLIQILTAWKDDEKVIKWTAKLDKHGAEFYSLKGEGLMKMKDSPPIYGLEFEDGAVIATHMGDYTFIMGCYNFDVKSLVKIFTFGIESAKQFNL